MTPPRILVADDDPHLREVVRYALARQGWDVLEVGDGAEAVRVARRERPDLVVMDVVMPELDGLEATRQLRAGSSTPVLFLSSRGEELDRVLGLEIGGDDYLTKPFSTRELISRIKAILRRVRPPDAEPVEGLRHGPLRLDLDAFRCHVQTAAGEVEVELTATELRLLAALMRHPGKVFSREALMERAYPDARFVADRTVDSHLRRVRIKLREHGIEAVETVHGVGFRLGA
jgi:two-component system OmpR family response regulator